MRINLDQVITDLRGEPFRSTPTVQTLLAELVRLGEENPDVRLQEASKLIVERLNTARGEPRMLGDLVYDALLTGEKATKGSPTEKRTRAKIAAQVVHGGIIDLAEADLAIIREEIGAYCVASALYACEEALVEHKEIDTSPQVTEVPCAAEAAE